MAKFIFFGSKVSAGELAGARAAGKSFDDAHTGVFELLHFFGIVREQAGGVDAKSLQSLGGKCVVAGIGGESKAAIGLDGVEAFILKLISLYFVEQADTAPFLR